MLIDVEEICDVLENDTVCPPRSKPNRMVKTNRSCIFFQDTTVSGISFNISGIGKVSLSQGAFKRMCHLQFLSVFKLG